MPLSQESGFDALRPQDRVQPAHEFPVYLSLGSMRAGQVHSARTVAAPPVRVSE